IQQAPPDGDGGPGPPGGVVIGEILSGPTVVAGPSPFGFGLQTSSVTFPTVPASTGSIRTVEAFNTRSADGSIPYRVLAQPLSNGQGVLLIATPLTEVAQTLHRLFLIEALVAGAVALGLGMLSWWTVRRELRPLDRIGETA